MKKISTLFISLCFILFFSTTISAAESTILNRVDSNSPGTILNELEPNNSKEQSQRIQKNNVNPSKVIKGNYEGQFVVVGKISDKSDEDWYKVSLNANDSTVLTVNSPELSGTAIFSIYDENMNLIETIRHHQDIDLFSISAYDVKIPRTGDYYVKVISPIHFGEYRFFIGGPDYRIGSYTYKANNPCTLTQTTKSVEETYDLKNISSIPDESIVYYVSISGRKENRASNEYRSIKLENDVYWTPTAMYTYYADIPVINNKVLRNKWMFKLEGDVGKYTNYYRLTPEIRFSYVYPVLPK